MPKVGVGAATQAAARKVAESDKSAGTNQTERDRRIIAENKENYNPADDAANIEADKAKTTSKPPARRGAVAKETDRKTETVNRLHEGVKDALGFDPDTDFRMASLDEGTDFMIAVAYGPAGNRKTTSTLRATKALPGKILVIAAESGLKKTALASHGVDTSRVMVWPPRGVKLTYDRLEYLFHVLDGDLEQKPGCWSLLAWDSLTEVIQTLVDNAAAAEVERLTKIAKASKNKFEVRKTYEREGKDYQVVAGQFRQLLRKFRALPLHQVFVALEENREESVETVDGRMNKVGVTGPALPPSVRMDVEQHADVIIRMSVANVPGVGSVGLGRSAAAEDLRAKDRYHALPAIMVDPGWERIWGYVTGELKVDEDDVQSTVATVEVEQETESPGEKAERQKAERAERAAARKAAKESGEEPPKAAGSRRSTTSRVTASSGTPDNPPM